MLSNVFGGHQQGDHIGGIIADTGAKNLPILHFQGQRIGIWKPHITVRHLDRERIIPHAADRIDHIQRVIHIHALRALSFQPALQKAARFSS